MASGDDQPAKPAKSKQETSKAGIPMFRKGNTELEMQPGGSATSASLSRSGLAKSQGSSSNTANNSPKPSREPSPIRPRQKSNTTSRGTSSRRDSTDASPSRSATTAAPERTDRPEGAAIAVRRALLTTSTTPSLQPSTISNTVLHAPRPQKSTPGTSKDSGSHWPVSPRLKSPTPRENTSVKQSSQSSKPGPTQAKSTTPSKPSEPGETPAPKSQSPPASESDVENEDQNLAPGIRTPLRGTSGGSSLRLETVLESSLPNTPIASLQQYNWKGKGDDPEGSESQKSRDELEGDSSKNVHESGNESGGTKSDTKEMKKTPGAVRPPISSKPSSVLPPKTYAVLSSRAKPSSEGSAMTVETETVSSIPQVSVGGGTGDRGLHRGESSTSIRLKPSSETIRPKKEKKKTSRKTPSLNAGTASTRADIFEAKVASAVDEADSSDSDETFVYESNPPESHGSRIRYHSRTPSVTSTNTYTDQRGLSRTTTGLTENSHGVAGKRSMKFTNNPYAALDNDVDRAELGRGHSVGSVRGSATGSQNHQRIGHHGRANRNGHPSILDNESPFPHKSRLATGNTSRHSSRPTSPRNLLQRVGANGRKTELLSTYDLDVEGADDEQAPLIGSLRSNRSRNSRRTGGSRMQLKQQKQQNIYTRLLCCFIVSVMIVLVVVGATGFILATTKPLHSVKVCRIENVLASEQEIMLDMIVEAVNPNIFSITIQDMDVNVFAKSPHVGTDKFWREHPHVDPAPGWRGPIREERRKPSSHSEPATLLKSRSGSPEMTIRDNVDEGTDPPDEDPGSDSATMLLGRVFELDSALMFPGSPFERQPAKALGELRLSNPGNGTEAGGQERWERVIQHKFDLLVRGVLKYQLPFSSKTRTSTIQGNATILPDDSSGSSRILTISKSPCAHMDDFDDSNSPSKKVSVRFRNTLFL